MAEHSIATRVKMTFADPECRSYLPDYLRTIRENLRDTDERWQKSMRAMFGLILVFEFLLYAAISEVSIAGIKLSNVEILLKLIPIVVAYLYYATTSIGASRRFLREVHTSAMRQQFGPIHQNDLEHFLLPTSPFAPSETIGRATGTWKALLQLLSFPVILVVVFAPVAFEVHAFYKLLPIYGQSDPLMLISLGVSALFVIQGLALFQFVSTHPR